MRCDVVAVGTELLLGQIVDTNSSWLGEQLAANGIDSLLQVKVGDNLGRVESVLRATLAGADAVIMCGGLGPTHDDLTREAIAAACGSQLREDPELLAWLEEMFTRRGAPMPDANRKQSWLIDGASALHNAHGSAPGWWVERPDGRIVIALPGPPREMGPMWREQALPRLKAGVLGVDRASHTLRLTGIGESALVGLVGEEVLRAANPQVATYARADAVDLVVSAESDGRLSAAQVVDHAVGLLRDKVGGYVFAEGDETWADALARVIGTRTLSIVELGTAGQVAALLGEAPFVRFAELLRDEHDVAHSATNLGHYAQTVRDFGHADIGLAVHARQTRDTHVRIAISTAADTAELQRTAFLAGDEGRRRAALAAAAALWETLRASEDK